LNYFGVKATGIVEDVFTVGKLVPLVIFILVGIFLINAQNYFPLAPMKGSLPVGIGVATVLGLWAYLGIDNITVPMSEIRDGQKTVPRAIIITVIIVTTIYLAVCAVALGVAKYQTFLSSGTPLADIMQATVKGSFGGILGGLMILGGTIAIVGSANVIILGAPRISLALAKDGLFPKAFSQVHPKRDTPTVGIIAEGIIGITVLFLVADLESLANLAVLFTVFPYFLSCLATVQLIRKDKWKTRIIKTRWIAFIASAMSIILFGYFSPTILIVVIGLFLLGIPVYYWATRKSSKHKTKTNK
jgi:amino acid transporter